MGQGRGRLQPRSQVLSPTRLVVHCFTQRCKLKILILGPVYMEVGDPHVGEVTRLGGVTRLSI